MSSSDPKFDALMVDWLYDELDPAEAKSFEEHLESNPDALAEASALKRTRAAFQDLGDSEPPPALSSILMHEAARAVEQSPSLWARCAALFQPIFLHPAASAMATLVIVAGVAGALYSNKGDMVAEPTARSNAIQLERGNQAGNVPQAEPVAAPSALPTGGFAETTTVAGELNDQSEPQESPSQEGYRVGLASDGDEAAMEAAKDAPVAELKERADEVDTSFTPSRRTAKGKGSEGLRFDAKQRRSSRERTTRLRDANANAISGAGSFAKAPESPGGDAWQLNLEGAGASDKRSESESSRKAAKSKPTTKRDSLKKSKKKAQRPRPSAPSNKNARSNTAGKKEVAASWEEEKTALLNAAARGKRCREAGRVANDILDRKPAYYKKKVEGSKAVGACRSYVASETKRRASLRSKRTAKSRKSKSGSIPSKAKAAPQMDESNAQASE